jgi:hypothetical protein
MVSQPRVGVDFLAMGPIYDGRAPAEAKQPASPVEIRAASVRVAIGSEYGGSGGPGQNCSALLVGPSQAARRDGTELSQQASLRCHAGEVQRVDGAFAHDYLRVEVGGVGELSRRPATTWHSLQPTLQRAPQ